MNIRPTRPLTWFALVCATLFLAACGGGSGSGTSGSSGGTSAQSGTVGIMLTDGPTDQFDQVLAEITGIELIGGNGRVTVYSGDETVDLLQLSSVSDLFAVNSNIPAGSYEKIRLTLSSLTLVKGTGSSAEKISVKLPGNGKVDLNPRGSFQVVPGQSLILEVDVDAEKAIHIVKAGNSTHYNFRPVVFVRVLHGLTGSRLVRIHGTVQNPDTADGTFALCPTTVVSSMSEDDNFHDGERPCLQVSTSTDTGIFGESGDPDVIDSVQDGTELTAIGFIAHEEASDDGDSAMQSQSAASDMFDADFRLDAQVLELGAPGTFSRIAGTVDSTVQSDNRFGMDVDPNQGIATDQPLPVQLQTGTKIFSRDGDALTISDIQPSLDTVVDGVLNVPADSGSYLKSALVVLNMSPAPSMLSGTLQMVDSSAGTLTVTTDTGDTAVTVTSDTQYYVIDADTGSSEQLDDAAALSTYLDAASNPLTVNVYGTSSGGDFTATTVLVFGPVSG